MEHDPIHAAEQEQSQRKAALARARAKLVAARKPDEQQRDYGREIFAAFRTAGWVVFCLAVLGLMAWRSPQVFDPTTWPSEPSLPLVFGVLLAYLLTSLLINRRKASAPPAAVAIQDFYEAATASEGTLYRYVIRADLDGASAELPALRTASSCPSAWIQSRRSAATGAACFSRASRCATHPKFAP